MSTRHSCVALYVTLLMTAAAAARTETLTLEHVMNTGSDGVGEGGEFGKVHGVIVDKSTGRVYVADTANNRIQVFRPVADAELDLVR
jgi:DNA-binding beta-propeller fold protein YncE